LSFQYNTRTNIDLVGIYTWFAPVRLETMQINRNGNIQNRVETMRASRINITACDWSDELVPLKRQPLGTQG